MLVSGRPIAILTSNEREGVRGDFNLCFRVVEAVEKGTARCVHALQPVTPPHRGRPQSRFRHRIPGLSV